MQIQIKLMGMLRDQTPPEGVLELPDNADIEAALHALEIDPAGVHMFTVNGDIERNKQRTLTAGDELTVLPPVGGG